MPVESTLHRKNAITPTKPVVVETAECGRHANERLDASLSRVGMMQNRRQHQFLLILFGAWICITYTIIHGHVAVVRVLFVDNNKPSDHDASTLVLGLVVPESDATLSKLVKAPIQPLIQDSTKQQSPTTGQDQNKNDVRQTLEAKAEQPKSMDIHGDTSEKKPKQTNKEKTQMIHEKGKTSEIKKNGDSVKDLKENVHGDTERKTNKNVPKPGEKTPPQPQTARKIQQFIRQHEKQAFAKNTALEQIEPTNGCGNSQRWLNASRLGNIYDDPFLTEQLTQQMILNLENMLLPESTMSNVLEQTICHENSKFRNVTAVAEDEQNVRVWAVKLIYAALHYHQHRLAIPEAVLRYGNNQKCPTSNDLWKKHGVGVFDYECPDAKYLIMPLAGNGLGANVRGGTVGAFLVGLLTDRVVLFVNNAEQGGKYLQSPWLLASCPRKDYQCFFWPTSPCTLTQDEIGKAHFLAPGEYRQILRGNIPEELQHHKVWTFNSKFIPGQDIPKKSAEKLYDYATKLISAVPRKEYPDYVTMLKKAAETILVPDVPPDKDAYNYAARYHKAHHALVFYSVRPKPSNAHELKRIMSEIVPKNFHPDTSVGLPIRGSDKCIGESECISFDQHMQVISNEWTKHQKRMGFPKNTNPTIVFTTESKNVVEEQQTFVAEKRDNSHPFRFEFVMNTQDVHPDSGFVKDIRT
jgi:hypothetical protein